MKNEIFNANAFNTEIEKVFENEQRITYGISEESYSLGGETRKSFGIVGYADAENSSAIIVSARDLASDREELAELVEQCNRLQVSPIHFFEVVDDFLNNCNA